MVLLNDKERALYLMVRTIAMWVLTFGMALYWVLRDRVAIGPDFVTNWTNYMNWD
jgi:hypothetical protein